MMRCCRRYFEAGSRHGALDSSASCVLGFEGRTGFLTQENASNLKRIKSSSDDWVVDPVNNLTSCLKTSTIHIEARNGQDSELYA